jgi:hypothetical protein
MLLPLPPGSRAPVKLALCTRSYPPSLQQAAGGMLPSVPVASEPSCVVGCKLATLGNAHPPFMSPSLHLGAPLLSSHALLPVQLGPSSSPSDMNVCLPIGRALQG